MTAPGRVGSSVLLYTSPRPRLILAAARVLAVKSAASLVAGAWVGHAALAPAGAWGAAVAAVAAGGGVPAALQLAAGFFVLSALSGGAARAIVTRTVVRIERTVEPAEAAPSAAPDSRGPTAAPTIIISTPALLGSGCVSHSYPASALRGALPNSLLQGFRVPARRGRYSERFLFPVEPHWKSDDLHALRTLLYADYFRPSERTPDADAARVARELARGIEGFGPFRPAAFADPLAGTHQAWVAREGGLLALQDRLAAAEGRALAGAPLGRGVATAAAAGVPSVHPLGSSCALDGQAEHPPADGGDTAPQVWVADGTVWSRFVIPPAPTFEELRAREFASRAVAAASSQLSAEPVPSVPRVAIPAAWTAARGA